MTSFAPDQGTGTPPTTGLQLIIESLARHRANAPEWVIPTWAQVAAMLASVAAFLFSTYLFLHWSDPATPLLMSVSALIAVAAFSIDAAAAVQSQKTGTDR